MIEDLTYDPENIERRWFLSSGIKYYKSKFPRPIYCRCKLHKYKRLLVKEFWGKGLGFWCQYPKQLTLDSFFQDQGKFLEEL